MFNLVLITEFTIYALQGLISLALMLGSDYTQGVKGIGIVFAVKILKEFGDLKSFQDWLLSDTEAKTPLQKKLVGHLSHVQPHTKLFIAE